METNGDEFPCYVTKKRISNRNREINHFPNYQKWKKKSPVKSYFLERNHNIASNSKAHSLIAKAYLEATEVKSNLDDKFSIPF